MTMNEKECFERVWTPISGRVPVLPLLCSYAHRPTGLFGADAAPGWRAPRVPAKGPFACSNTNAPDTGAGVANTLKKEARLCSVV